MSESLLLLPACVCSSISCMVLSGDVEEVPEPGTRHPAEACMGNGGLAGPETMEKSRPVAAETTSYHHEAVALEQAAKMSTSKEGEEEKLLPPAPAKEEADGQESARERLKRHRREMAGRVWVPEMWGQEKLLTDWMDCSAFDRPLVPAGLLKARRALVAESCARRPAQTPPASSSPLRMQNGWS